MAEEDEKPISLDEHIAASKQNTADLESMREAYDDIVPVGGGRYASQKAADANELDEHEVIDADVQAFRRFGGYKLEHPRGRVPVLKFAEQFGKDVTMKPSEVICAVHAEAAKVEKR